MAVIPIHSQNYCVHCGLNFWSSSYFTTKYEFVRLLLRLCFTKIFCSFMILQFRGYLGDYFQNKVSSFSLNFPLKPCLGAHITQCCWFLSHRSSLFSIVEMLAWVQAAINLQSTIFIAPPGLSHLNLTSIL